MLHRLKIVTLFQQQNWSMQVLNCFPILPSFISGRCKHLFKTPSILAIGLISLFLCLTRIKINVLRRKLVCTTSYGFLTFIIIWKQLEVISSELDSFEGSTKLHETAESELLKTTLNFWLGTELKLTLQSIFTIASLFFAGNLMICF